MRERASRKDRAGVQGPVSPLLFSFWWERMKMTLNVTGAAERNWPETVLICVRKTVYSVFQSIPNKESGTSGCHRGSAKFDLRAFSELFSADPASRCCSLACYLHGGLAPPFSGLPPFLLEGSGCYCY